MKNICHNFYRTIIFNASALFRDILMHWNIIHLPTRPKNCIWIKWTKDGRSTGTRLYGQMKMEKR